MNTWLVPSILATLCGSVLVAVVFLYLEFREHTPGMRRWALAWVFYSLRLAFDLVEAWIAPGSVVAIAGSHLLALIAGLLLLNGSLELMGRRIPAWPRWVGAFVASWVVLASFTGISGPLVSAPVFLVLGVANIAAGVAWFRFGADAGPWARITGASFFVWGVHKFDYPLLRVVAWFAPLGYLLSALLEFIVAFGALLAYFERTRSRLARSEQRYAALFEGSSSVMLLIDPDTEEIIDANQAAAAYYGWSRARLRQMYINEIDTLRPEEIRAELALAAERHRDHFLFRHRRADGQVCDVEVYAGPIVVDGRRLLYSIVHDITQRVMAEQALRESEARYGTLFRESRSAMLLVDPAGARIVDANTAAERLYGYPIGRLKEMGVDDLSIDTPDRIHEKIASAIAQKQQVETFRHVRADGSEVDVEISATPVVFEGRTLLFTIVTDISERLESQRKLEEYRSHLEDLVTERTRELTETNTELEAATRAKDDFMTSMSHELRTPLNSVIGFSDMLLRELPGPVNEEQRRQIDMIGQSGRHLLSLVNEILDLARIEAGNVEVHHESVDVARLIERLATGAAPLASRGAVTIETHVEPGVALATDERLLEQILWNLVGNAVKFTPGGHVDVRVDTGDERVRFIVTDDGQGMTPEQLAGAFEKFTRYAVRGTDQGGTGLGLSISARLAEYLGACLSAESEYGLGSSFVLDLPSGMEAKADQ